MKKVSIILIASQKRCLEKKWEVFFVWFSHKAKRNTHTHKHELNENKRKRSLDMSPFRDGADGFCCCAADVDADAAAAADAVDNVTWLLCASVSRPLSMNRLLCSWSMLPLLLLVAPGILSVFALLSGELATILCENEEKNDTKRIKGYTELHNLVCIIFSYSCCCCCNVTIILC